MRGGRFRHSVILECTELVPDPGFDDPYRWDITTSEGTAEVTGGQLVCTDFLGSVTPVGMDAPVVGETYNWEINVASTDGLGDQAVYYAGMDGENPGFLWQEFDAYSDGAGVFTGSGEAKQTLGLFIAIVDGTGNLVINSISIKSKGPYAAFAAIEPIGSKNLLTQHKYYGDTTHRVTVRYSSDIADIDNTWRVIFGSRTFIITGVIDINERKNIIVLHCREGVRDSNEPAI